MKMLKRELLACATMMPFIVVGSSALAAGASDNTIRPLHHVAVAPPAHVAAAAVKTRHGRNDDNTTSPIKHVIIIVGENRSFDHLFATYVSPSGDSVMNLLSEGIVNADGTPGPNYTQAAQQQATDTSTYSVSPTTTGSYSTLPPPNLAFTPVYAGYAGSPWINTEVAAQYDYGLLPKQLVATTEGASGLPQKTIDTRIANVYNLPSGPFQLSPGVGSETYANSPVHRFYQMFQQMDCNASYATTANPSGCRNDLFP